jgi:hypothetical protein
MPKESINMGTYVFPSDTELASLVDHLLNYGTRSEFQQKLDRGRAAEVLLMFSKEISTCWTELDKAGL